MELACGDVPVHDVLYHVPQAGPHHGGRPVARAVNLHEYAALRVAATENIFQAAANIFACHLLLVVFHVVPTHALAAPALEVDICRLAVRGLVTSQHLAHTNHFREGGSIFFFPQTNSSNWLKFWNENQN